MSEIYSAVIPYNPEENCIQTSVVGKYDDLEIAIGVSDVLREMCNMYCLFSISLCDIMHSRNLITNKPEHHDIRCNNF